MSLMVHMGNGTPHATCIATRRSLICPLGNGDVPPFQARAELRNSRGLANAVPRSLLNLSMPPEPVSCPVVVLSLLPSVFHDATC
jgi:hypothetical protein